MSGPTTTRGHTTGLGWLNGWPQDAGEEVPELSWPLNVATYDRMHRGESQAKSVFNAVTMPVRRAAWVLDPNGAPDDVVKLIAGDLNLPVLGRDDLSPKQLRRRKRFDFRRHVGAASMHLAYGHMPFEIVGDVMADNKWHLLNLEERMPSTLAKINVARNGDLVSLTQWPAGSPGEVVQFGIGVEMPAENLVMYVHERVGGLWQGQSIYRTSYRHYLVKDRLIRVDAMKHERNGMGIPWIESAEGATPAIVKDNEAIASRLRGGEMVGGALPYGSKLHIAGVEGSLPDTISSIRYHDEMMGVETLTQFLQLGKTAHGSRALGDTLADFFIMVLQTVADELADTFNEQLIEQWVDWNWGESTPAPLVTPGDIGSDTALTAEALAALVQSGALQVDASVDAWIRTQFKLPSRPENDPFVARKSTPAPDSTTAASRRPFDYR